ncbi:ABC transporter ATP-binding protein [Baekduia sp. Peel2402]|uniref:ABC transporter ATP-binding protein n=1 Tax=Baekduia sp. Peel2402 TaxID=3458296 RepID=UPI00403E5588
MAQLDLDIGVALRAYALRVGLAVGTAETVALVGPSGAGKSTVLRAVAGLLHPDDGRIALGDDVWFDAARGVRLAPERRSVGLVFQDHALFPHLTVLQNVAFGGTEPAARELLERFGIAPLANEKPGRLSGGERQRVALARALARDPGVLLLDEPLSALDAHTRAVVRAELAGLLRTLAIPALLVTHDHRDAIALADRIGVIVDGELRQVGTPGELLRAPADPFVATFTGANVVGGLAVQPWDVRVATEAPDDDALVVVEGLVEAIEDEGPRARVRVGGVVAEVPAPEAARLAVGARAWATFARSDAHQM